MLRKKVRYPKEFPLFRPSEFMCGNWNEPVDGVDEEDATPESCARGCLEGWGFAVFEGKTYYGLGKDYDAARDRPWFKKLQETVLEFANKMGLAEAIGSHPDMVMKFNDTVKNQRTLARVWARFGAKLGYTEGNPEAKYV